MCKKYFPKQKELSRKIVHIGTGPLIPLAWWLEVSTEIALGASAIVSLGLILNYYLNFLPTIENVDRESYGTITYGLSITLLIAQFWSDNPAIVCVGVLVMAIGDGFAGLIGKQYKSFQWKILGQNKSILGTLTMFFGTIVIIIIFTSINNNQIHPLPILGIALMATMLEQISPFGIDNITVPISTAWFWNWMITS